MEIKKKYEGKGAKGKYARYSAFKCSELFFPMEIEFKMKGKNMMNLFWTSKKRENAKKK